MTYLGYAALAVLILATLITFARSYRSIRDGKVGRRLVDLGLTLTLVFVTLVIATYMSVTALALVSGSTVITTVIALIGAAGLLLIVTGSFYDGWRASAQNRRVRLQQRKMAKRDDSQRAAQVAAEKVSAH